MARLTGGVFALGTLSLTLRCQLPTLGTVTAVRVLVVDDDPWILRMVSSSLEKNPNYAVETARDGRQALQKVQASPPNLVITDVMMPVMDGWAFVQQLRNIPRLAEIPVLFLTALGKDEDRLAALGLTPQDYVSKPFRFDELERRVLRLLAGEQSGPASDSSNAPAPGFAQQSRFGNSQGFGQPQQAQPQSSAFGPAGFNGVDHRPGLHGQQPSMPSHTARPQQRFVQAQPGHAPSQAAPPIAKPRRRATGLNGRLEQLGLSSLLVMMEMERKGGVLALFYSPDKRIGRIFLRKGRVVHATIDASPATEARECVYEMLTWQKGKFSFRGMEIDMKDTVETSTTSLLMEGARLIDEGNR